MVLIGYRFFKNKYKIILPQIKPVTTD